MVKGDGVGVWLKTWAQILRNEEEGEREKKMELKLPLKLGNLSSSHKKMRLVMKF